VSVRALTGRTAAFWPEFSSTPPHRR